VRGLNRAPSSGSTICTDPFVCATTRPAHKTAASKTKPKKYFRIDIIPKLNRDARAGTRI